MNKILIILLLTTLVSCGDDNTPSISDNNSDSGSGSGSGSGSDSDSGSNGTILSKIKVKDTNDQMIGYLIDSDPGSMTIMTSKGFIYTIGYDGKFNNFNSSVYRDTAGKFGTTKVGVDFLASYASPSTKLLLFSSNDNVDDNFDNFQICRRSDYATATVVAEREEITYASHISPYGESVGSGTENYYVWDDCKETGNADFRSEIGFPENAIEPPFSFSFE